MKYMFVYKIIVFCFCTVVFMGGCNSTPSYLPTIHVSADFDEIVEIKNWLAIGPFEFDTITGCALESFYYDDLKPYGIEEGWINDAGIKKLLKQGVNGFIIRNNSFKTRLIDYINESIEDKSNIYLITRIISAKDQNVTLIMDGSHSYAGWLNGEKLLEIRMKHNSNKISDKYINVFLNEGENILFFKVNRGTNLRSWDLVCAISSLQEAQKIFHVNNIGDFINDPLVNDSIEICAGPYLSGNVIIVNNDEQIVAEGSFIGQNNYVISGLKELPDGFYRTILTVGDEKMEQMVYKGDYDVFFKQAKVYAAKVSGNASFTDDLKANLRAVRYFNDNPGNSNSPSEIRYYNRNRVFWGYSLHKMLNNTVTATRLMTYKEENGFTSDFIFYISNQQKQNIPLIFIVPYNLTEDSFFKDWYMTHLSEIEPNNALAEEYGFAIVWLYAGGKNYSANKTKDEITAILSRLEKDYDIDKRNIFIFGECEGGRRALVQLSLTPDRYAACGASSPITLSGGYDGIPINIIPQMGKIPVIIKHGINDNVISIEQSRMFVSESQKHGLPVEYVETGESHDFMYGDHNRFAFEFFSRIAQNR